MATVENLKQATHLPTTETGSTNGATNGSAGSAALAQMLAGRYFPFIGQLDTFGLRAHDWKVRVPERSEMFTIDDAMTYIDGCDYPESADDLLFAWELRQRFGAEAIHRMSMLDAMCGPGILGRKLLILGAKNVIFHDGDKTMTAHARNQASGVLQPGQGMDTITSAAEAIPVADNTFDLVVCHNSTHQLSDIDKLQAVTRELLRITAPGGHVVIADFQRGTTDEYFRAVEQRLIYTKPEIVPLLVPSLRAAFSRGEFAGVIGSIPGIRRWSVVDAQLPTLAPWMQQVVDEDPVKGHIMDFSPISLRAIVQKE